MFAAFKVQMDVIVLTNNLIFMLRNPQKNIPSYLLDIINKQKIIVNGNNDTLNHNIMLK